MRKLIFLLFVLLALASYSGPDTPHVGSEPPPQSGTGGNRSESEGAVSDGELGDSHEPSEDFDSILNRLRQQGLVVDSAFGDPLTNTVPLMEWVQSYRHGYSGTVSVLLDGLGFPSALFTLESDGSPTYTITEYWQSKNDEAAYQTTYQSSVVLERAYDYVFGADIPADMRSHAVVIHHTVPPTAEEMVWDPAKNDPFHGITPMEAEQRAKEVEYRIYKHMSVIPSIYAGGVYLKESVLEEADEEYGESVLYYKTVGAIRLDDRICYLVYGNTDKEALEQGEHSGSVTAVSADGALVFIQSMVDGSWIFADDANQATYPGTWPEVRTDFYSKAHAMGYTDKQLALLENASWASANTVLNLTKMHDLGFSGGPHTDRYALDGYLVEAGGEAMTACMYLRDNQTGRTTILPDWQNGYSSFGFLDEKRFYAAIAQVGGADYEAGVRFYSADSPDQPYARWDLTDSRVKSEMEKRLLTAYNSMENSLLAVFWCEIPVEWGGWVEGDTQTYQVALLDRSGIAVKSFDTGVKLAQGTMGISPPNCEKPHNSLPPVPGAIYFDSAETTYILNLESGEIETRKD